MRFAGWAARRVLQQAFHIDPTKKSCVQQYWWSNDFSPLQTAFKIYFYPIKHGSPLEHCSEGLPCFIFILLCPVFCRCRFQLAVCRLLLHRSTAIHITLSHGRPPECGHCPSGCRRCLTSKAVRPTAHRRRRNKAIPVPA